MSISEYLLLYRSKNSILQNSQRDNVRRQQLFGKTLTNFSGKSAVFELLKILFFFLNMTVPINSENLGAPVQNNFRCSNC